MEAEASPSVAGVDQEPARGRREWERIAYGPDASEEERRAAQAALEKLRTPLDAAPSASPDAAVASEHPDAPASDPRPLRSRFRFGGVAVAACVVATLLVAVALLPRLLEPGSMQVFERAQTDADQNIPTWLANALATAAGASGQAGAGAEVHRTVRRIHDGERAAFVFTDAAAETVCMAVAADALACVPSSTFGREGIRIEGVSQAGSSGPQGLRFEWGPRGGLRSEAFEFDSPLRAFPMAAGDWSVLVTRCMAERGYTVETTSEGDLLPQIGSDVSTLGFTINRVGCTARYPLYGVAYGPASSAEG